MSETMKSSPLEAKKQEIWQVLESKISPKNLEEKKQELDKIALAAEGTEGLDVIGKDKVRRAVVAAKEQLEILAISREDSQEAIRGPYLQDYKENLQKEIPVKLAQLQKKHELLSQGAMRLDSKDQQAIAEQLNVTEKLLETTDKKLKESLADGPRHSHAEFIDDLNTLSQLLSTDTKKDPSLKPLSQALYHGEQLDKYQPYFEQIRQILLIQKQNPQNPEKFKEDLEAALKKFIENVRPYLQATKTIGYVSYPEKPQGQAMDSVDPQKPETWNTELGAQLTANNTGEITVSFGNGFFSYSEEHGFSASGKVGQPLKNFEEQYQRFAQINGLPAPGNSALPTKNPTQIAQK